MSQSRKKKYELSNEKYKNSAAEVVLFDVLLLDDALRKKNGRAIISVTSRRNLSQLGDCYGTGYERTMVFGDTMRFTVGKTVGYEVSYICRYATFPNKLFRFARS